MKAIVSQRNLKKKLALIQDIMKANKKALPELNSFLLNCKGDISEIHATDLDKRLILYCSEFKIQKKGAVVIPNITETINHLTGDMEIELINDKVKVTAKSTTYEVEAYNYEDFPVYENFIVEEEITIPANTLLSTIDKVIYAVLDPKQTPQIRLTGVCFHIIDNYINIVGTDGYRLSLVKVDIADKKDKEWQIIIPKATVKKLRQLLSINNHKDIKIGFNDKHIYFKGIDFELYSRLIEASYPNYKAVIPKKYVNEVKLNTREFGNAIKLFAKNKDTDLVVLEFNKNKLTMRTDDNSIKQQININSSKSFLPIGFNPNYLLDVIKTINSLEFVFKLNTLTDSGFFGQPSTIQDINDNNYLALIMPKRYKSDNGDFETTENEGERR